MAIYHLQIKIISRGKGRSAVAAAAYRAGEKIRNEYDGVEHDYTRKGGIVHTAILLPENAPPEYADRAVLWNAVERVEKAKNSQLAREIELALPVELTRGQNIFLVYEYVKHHFVRQGMCADITLHEAERGNPHAHVMLTMRPFNEDRSWGDKQKKVYHLDEQGNKIYDPVKRQYACNKIQTTDWHEQSRAEEWRQGWADYVNGVLEHNGHAARVDHRSFERQGLEQIPTIHLGAAAFQMERRGIRTERGDINREIEISNRRLREMAEQINELQGWLFEEMQNTQPPTFADVISGILSRQGQIVVNTAIANQILKFLKNKQIKDYAGLEKHLSNLMGKQSALAHQLSPVRKKYAEVTERINRYATYKERKAEYDKYITEYNAQKPWKRKTFEDDNRLLINDYEESKKYIGGLLNSKNQIPIRTWQKEKSDILAQLQKLGGEYESLKAEVSSVGKMRVQVYDILRKERQREQPQRSHGMEL